jgi:hypothetical protein
VLLRLAGKDSTEGAAMSTGAEAVSVEYGPQPESFFAPLGDPFPTEPPGPIIPCTNWGVYALSRDFLARPTAAQAARLAKIVGTPATELLKRMNSKKAFVWLARNVSQPQADQVRDLHMDHVDIVCDLQ